MGLLIRHRSSTTAGHRYQRVKNMSIIAPDNHFAVFTALMVISGAAFLLERTRVGAAVTGTVIVILLAIIAANLHIIPHDAPAYGFVFSYIVPALIPLFLFQADLRRLVKEASRTTAAFFIATLGTILGVCVAGLVLDLGSLATAAGMTPEQREAGIVGLFASTYIGGSVNYAALGEITGLNRDASFFSAATAADNLFSAVFLSTLALIPGTHWLAKHFVKHEPTGPQISVEAPKTEARASAASLCLAIAAATLLVTISDACAQWLDFSGGRYVILTLLSLTFATLVPQAQRWLAGAFELGVALSFAFFAAIAAGANIPAMIGVAPMLIALVLILLTVHLVTLLSLGALFKLTLPELLTASNAAVLGATTAPAMAAAKGWHDQVTPGVLVGVLGYALGTFIGTGLFQIW